jgi:lambda repressor-like predicted transcriptional regulator
MAFDRETVKSYVDKGVEVSRDALTKAGAAVKDWSDKGVVQLELAQLKTRLKKNYEKLGQQVYEALSVQPQTTLTSEDALIAGFLTEITRLRSEIDKRATEKK